jgi:anti-sigma-K factor RskA
MSASAKYADRISELLVQRATDSLNASEQLELNRLLAEDKQADGYQFEQTTAALLLAGISEEEAMPEALKAKLMGQAENFVLNMAARSPVVNMPLAENAKVRSRAASRSKTVTVSRWPWVATAAAMVVALAGWWPRLVGVDEASQIEEVLADQPTLKREWQRTEDPAAKDVTGEVVWNQATQMGYMRFRGLAANDSQRVQYQLWIFDRSRGDKYPVDGGVFDVAVNQGEVLVPITARLPVRDPAMFAVTLERAGGVVVSEREHILVLAKVAG